MLVSFYDKLFYAHWNIFFSISWKIEQIKKIYDRTIKTTFMDSETKKKL